MIMVGSWNALLASSWIYVSFWLVMLLQGLHAYHNGMAIINNKLSLSRDGTNILKKFQQLFQLINFCLLFMLLHGVLTL
jgi:hypothetical protein